MTSDDARQLRQKLEALDALLPLLREDLTEVQGVMDAVCVCAELLPDEDCCRDLLRYLTAVEPRLDALREKAKGLSE
jgi:hypothetical protein